MRFSIYLSTSSQKFLKKLDEINYERIIKRLEGLSKDPFPPDAKRIIGRKETKDQEFIKDENQNTTKIGRGWEARRHTPNEKMRIKKIYKREEKSGLD